MPSPPQPGVIDWDAPEIAALIRAALEEDLGARDVTTQALVPADARAQAQIVAKRDLVLAGLPLVERVFQARDENVQCEAKCEEGARVPAGSRVALIRGRARSILSAERTALNFLAHLSGVATETRRYVEAVAGTLARIRDTRKTLPSLRALEKYAVRVGGGSNHRLGLFDAILIKENHIALAGSVAEALRRAQEYTASLEPASAEMTAYESFRPPAKSKGRGGRLSIQIEVRSEGELRDALAAGAEAVLLDNMPPRDVALLVRLVRHERPGCLVEVSGGVNLSNVRPYAEAGADFISVGALTHSAPAADLSLLVELPEHE